MQPKTGKSKNPTTKKPTQAPSSSSTQGKMLGKTYIFRDQPTRKRLANFQLLIL